MKLILENWKKYLKEQENLQEVGFAPPMPGEALDRRTKNQTGATGAAHALMHDWSKQNRRSKLRFEDGLIGMGEKSGSRVLVSEHTPEELKELKLLIAGIVKEENLSCIVKLSKEGQSYVFSLINSSEFDFQ